MAENGIVHQVTAVIYIKEGDIFKAAALDDDYTIPDDYIEGIDLGSWLDLVVGGDEESVQFSTGDWPRGEIRDGIFMIYEIAKDGFSEYESLNTYICETEHYGFTACCEGIVPLGLPEGVPILIRRTTDEEERRFLDGGHQHSILSHRWIVCAILGSVSVTEPQQPEERVLVKNKPDEPPMTLENEPVMTLEKKVAEPPLPTRKGVVTCSTAYNGQCHPGYVRKCHIWTPGLRVGIEFTLYLRPTDVPLCLGNWIEFPIANAEFEHRRDKGFQVMEFKKVKPGYLTQAVRTTVEITIPHVLIDNLKDREFGHIEFGTIWDRDNFLIFDKVMDITVVRGRPKIGAYYCWRVVTARTTPDRDTTASTSRSPNPVVPRFCGGSPANYPPAPVPSTVPLAARMEAMRLNPAPHVRPSGHTASPKEQSAPASRPTNAMIPVSVVSLGAATRVSDVRSEVAFITATTNQNNVYTIWMTQSHLEGCLHYPSSKLHLGATFQGKFYIENNQVVKSEFIEEVENVVDGGIDNDDKIMIYSDVMYRRGDTFWNNILGIVRDPRGIAQRNELSQAVVIGRLRLADIPGFSWTITGLSGQVSLPPHLPIQQNNGYIIKPTDAYSEQMREMLEAFRQFFLNDTLNAIALRDSPHDHFLLDRYFSQN